MLEAYINLRCRIPKEHEEDLPDLMASWPVLGTEIGQELDGWVQVSAFLSVRDFHAAEGVTSVLASVGARDLDVETIEEEDWLAGFRDQVRPFSVGRLWWIDPHPDTPTPASDGRHHLQIEPRMAFGSGSHESTQLILLEMEELEILGASVLDVGTGSGILALASDRLGARNTVGVDIDATSIWIAREIAGQQVWSPRLNLAIGSMGCIGEGGFDVVLCNMITANFVPLLDEIRRALAAGGVAVFSGLLVVEIDPVKEALALAGLFVRSERHLAEWASLIATAESIR